MRLAREAFAIKHPVKFVLPKFNDKPSKIARGKKRSNSATLQKVVIFLFEIRAIRLTFLCDQTEIFTTDSAKSRRYTIIIVESEIETPRARRAHNVFRKRRRRRRRRRTARSPCTRRNAFGGRTPA